MIMVFIWEGLYLNNPQRCWFQCFRICQGQVRRLQGQFLQWFFTTKVRDIVIDHKDDNDAFHHLHSHPEVHPDCFGEILNDGARNGGCWFLFVQGNALQIHESLLMAIIYNQSIVFSALHSDSACNMYFVLMSLRGMENPWTWDAEPQGTG